MGTDRYAELVARAGAMLCGLVASGVLVVAALLRPFGTDARVIGLCCLALISAAGLWLSAARVSARATSVMCVTGATLAPVAVLVAGPAHFEMAAILPACAAPVYFCVRRRVAGLAVVCTLGGLAAVLAFADGYADPVASWALVASCTGSSALVSRSFASLLARIASSERSASAEVLRLNTLLDRQCDELARFTTPQVATAVRDTSDPASLAPHRCELAVLFCDLRGFTAFTGAAEPEEVVELVAGYYAVVEHAVDAHGATVGAFIGDGVMCYIDDAGRAGHPVDDAVALAAEIGRSLDPFLRRWSSQGFTLGFGIGIAFGHVTVGAIGHGTRREFTALGNVVNLASRLCGEAQAGQLLMDARAHAALARAVPSTEVELALKGFSGSVRAYQLPAIGERASLATSGAR